MYISYVLTNFVNFDFRSKGFSCDEQSWIRHRILSYLTERWTRIKNAFDFGWSKNKTYVNNRQIAFTRLLLFKYLRAYLYTFLMV